MTATVIVSVLGGLGGLHVEARIRVQQARISSEAIYSEANLVNRPKYFLRKLRFYPRNPLQLLVLDDQLVVKLVPPHLACSINLLEAPLDHRIALYYNQYQN